MEATTATATDGFVRARIVIDSDGLARPVRMERQALPISAWGSEAARIAARQDEANLAPTSEMYAAAMQAVS